MPFCHGNFFSDLQTSKGAGWSRGCEIGYDRESKSLQPQDHPASKQERARVRGLASRAQSGPAQERGPPERWVAAWAARTLRDL